MLLSPPAITTDRFLYDADEKLLVAEASDLGPDFRVGRVYDDACDEGFTLISVRTGRRVVFALYHTERREGDVLYDEYRAAPYQPGVADVQARVQIFND